MIERRNVFLEVCEGFDALAKARFGSEIDSIDQVLFESVAKALGGREKALAWFDARNPMLGDVTPKEMIRAGQSDRLLKFIRSQAAEWKSEK